MHFTKDYSRPTMVTLLHTLGVSQPEEEVTNIIWYTQEDVLVLDVSFTPYFHFKQSMLFSRYPGLKQITYNCQINQSE